MSIRDQIPILEELAEIDAAVRIIDEEIGQKRGNLDGMRTEVKALEERIHADTESLSNMDKTRAELLIEVRQMTSQIERSREKLQRSRNERESNAAQRELEELRKLLRDREDEVEKLSGLADQAKDAIDNASGKATEVNNQLEGTVDGATADLSKLDAKRAEYMERREGVVKRLPANLYRRYQSLRTRRPVAIASNNNGTCNGCFMTVPPMMFQKMLRQEEFEQCPSCRRIIYYRSKTEEEANEGESAHSS